MYGLFQPAPIRFTFTLLTLLTVLNRFTLLTELNRLPLFTELYGLARFMVLTELERLTFPYSTCGDDCGMLNEGVRLNEGDA
jgi:hypothetical protein